MIVETNELDAEKKRKHNISKEDNSEEVETSLNWIRAYHALPITEETLKHWKKTANVRLESIEESTDLNTIQVFIDYPILKQQDAYKLILSDFDHLNLSEETLNFEKWNLIFHTLLDCQKISKSDKIGRDLLSQYTCIQDEMVQNENSIVALQLLMLPHLIPSTNSRKLSKTETWKVSVGDSKQSIIQFAIDSTLIPDLLSKKKEFAEKHKISVQPFIFVVGEDLKNIKESYVIFDSISYKLPSTLEAFKVCFKLFHVLLLKYPFESEHLYILIQKLLKIKTQWDDKIFPCTEHALHTVQKKLEDFPFPDLL
ncbi:uncharacterized protein LOC106650103 [Trichogramma pretiosum]|nr:uncharacterized protein LOC106650103 [Trichogramma pretiosum]